MTWSSCWSVKWLEKFGNAGVYPGGDVFTISGNDNTLVFREGDAVALHSLRSSSLTITGTGNTIYIPPGSSITVTGGATALNTARIYNF